MAKILVIEDELGIQKVIRANLAASGYTILTAENGEDGLELANSNRPDLILLDLMMPGISGWDVLDKMKQEQQLSSIPVIVITASAWGDSEQKLRDMGAVDYIVKPFDLDDLLRRVKAALKE